MPKSYIWLNFDEILEGKLKAKTPTTHVTYCCLGIYWNIIIVIKA